MNGKVVADSTCLIGLERIDLLEILPGMFEAVWVPPEVEKEFGRTLSWATVQKPRNLALVESLKLSVDVGEAEAIALAQENGFLLIVDDHQARTAARRLGVKIVGTVGLLVIAKREGFIELIKPVLDNLKRKGFYVGESLHREALRLAGE